MLDILRSRGCQMAAAPAARQHQNGLVERAWRTIVRMARTWLTQNLLPTQFWYHAIRRAVEVCNFLLVKTNGKITTPRELVHGTKLDMRTLFPLFSIAYVRKTRDGNVIRTRFALQALCCILIGSCARSDGLELYHPATKQYISSSDYALDTSRPSGPAFDLPYDGGVLIGLYDSKKKDIPIHEQAKMCMYYPKTSSPQPAIILSLNDPGGTPSRPWTYNIQMEDGTCADVPDDFLRIIPPPINTRPPSGWSRKYESFSSGQNPPILGGA